jgi:hypothetical protein
VTPLRTLRALLREALRLLAAALCRLDIHDLPAGYHRVGPDEADYGRPIWDVPCRGCRVLFAAQTDVPHPELENRVERAMWRHRAGRPVRDRRPS